MLAEKGLQPPANGHSTRLKQARKSVGSGIVQYRASKHSNSTGRHKTARGVGIPEETDDELKASEDAAAWGASDSVSNLVVQETDEDEDFVPNDSQEAADPYDFPTDVEDDDFDLGMGRQTGNIGPRRPGRPRARLAKSAPTSAPVVAVKKVKKKMGGARPGAGRKRKRPVVVNSDDE